VIRTAPHPLDRPVWNSLCTSHACLSVGGDLARRYRSDVNLFASSRDDGREVQEALAALVAPGETIYILQAAPITIPRALIAAQQALGVQMVATKAVAAPEDERVMALADEDAPEMVALAELTKPGPFLVNTQRMGEFIGVRIGGRLAAMAGERMRFPGFTEVSGVCTHPDFRGQDIARLLSMIVAARIAKRGDTPFLHAWKTNVAAIALYESLGFRRRADVNVAVLTKA
jgi:predicted GNAT family acetyltransferase